MAPGLRQFTERRGDGAGEPVLDNENGEDLMYVQPGVSIVIGNRSPESQGTVYISTKKVVWLSDVDRTKGYAVDFLSLSLHAVSRDPEAYSSPCIYTQIETGEDGNESEDSDSESNDALDLSKVTEMRLVPSDPGQLNTLFQILCDCAELNPEPIEDDEELNWIFSANQQVDETAEEEDSEWNFSQNPSSSIGHSNGHHDLARTVLEVVWLMFILKFTLSTILMVNISIIWYLKCMLKQQEFVFFSTFALYMVKLENLLYIQANI